MRGLLVALALLSFAPACNNSPGPTPDGLDDYRWRSSGPVWGRRGDDGRLVSLFWDLPADDSGEVTAERAVLRLLGADLGIYDPDMSTRIVGSVPIGPDGTVTIFQLVHAGVDVYGAEVRVVRVGDRIRYLSARLPPPILLDVEPLVEAAEVQAAIGEQLGLTMTPPMSEPELVVFDSAMLTGGGGTPRLAWKLDVGARPGGGTAFVSAVSGNVMQLLDPRETFAEIYFVRQSEDDLGFTGEGGVREHWFSEMGGALVSAPTAEPAATNFMEAEQAYMDARALYAYFNDNFGWEGYDGQGALPNVFVGYSATCDTCPVAAWLGTDYTARTVGTDPFAEYILFSTNYYSTDVFAHEYVHGLLDYATRRDPFNYWIPGATEESLADTFAAFFDTASPWVMGDMLPVTQQRDLRTPRDNDLGDACSSQPEHMDELVGLEPTGTGCDLLDVGECNVGNDQICLGAICYHLEGNGHTHCNSAIPSLAAYRLTDGDPAHDVEGMGVEKAQVLYFTALQLVGRWETFRDLRDHLLAACHLWAESGVALDNIMEPITAEDCGDVINAFHSVGVTDFADSDRDGWDDLVDNCRATPNFDQLDANDDRVGDACEGGTTADEDYYHCYWRDVDHCVFDNDPREVLRTDCMGDGAVWAGGQCPAGGVACVDDRGDRVIGFVWYDGDATQNMTRQTNCDGATERWEASYSPSGG